MQAGKPAIQQVRKPALRTGVEGGARMHQRPPTTASLVLMMPSMKVSRGSGGKTYKEMGRDISWKLGVGREAKGTKET